MARSSRPARGLTRHDRLDLIREQIPEHEDGPSIADEIQDRHGDSAEQARVASWFKAAIHPDSPDAERACCRTHAWRRAYAWLKADEHDDLEQIEQRHMCAQLTAS